MIRAVYDLLVSDPWKVIATIVAMVSICFNIAQYRWNRRTKIAVKISVDESPLADAVTLQVDVENNGTELNDLNASVEFQGEIELLNCRITEIEGTANPFKFGYSCRFKLTGYDLLSEEDSFRKRGPEEVAVVVRSGVRELTRIPATKWRYCFDALRKNMRILEPE